MAKKLLFVVVIALLSGAVGYQLGTVGAQLSFRNWKPAVVTNKLPAAQLVSSQKDIDFSLFWTVWDKVNAMYVDKTKLDPKKMVDGAISGMVAAIGDPYTMYLPYEANKSTKEELGGSFDGVGIQLGYESNQLAVQTPIDGSPAAKAGVQAGDLILHIKDEVAKVDRDTDGMTLPEAVKLIRGQKGSTVTLTLYRQKQQKPFEVNLVRDTIVVKSVTAKKVTINGKTAELVKLSRFGDRTNDEWMAAVQQYRDECTGDCKGMILDLRNNPGGYLESAVYVAGEFLPAGKTVVTQQYGDGRKLENKVSRNGILQKGSLVVLVNKGSASAAEILSGALQDYERARVVGVQSFGKGSVQQPEDFPDGSGIHVTIAKWLRPSGDWIDHKGITPNEVVPWENPKEGKPEEDPQLTKAMQML